MAESTKTSDPIAITVAALLPMLLLAITVAAEKLVDQPLTRIGKVLAMTNFLGLSALCPLGPMTLISLIGAIALHQNSIRMGDWFAKVASTCAVLTCALLGVSVMSDAFGSTSRIDWHPMYSPPAALLTLTPHLVIAAANIYVLVRLSKRLR